MSRCILIYGQPGAGKTFSLRTLDPASTVIIDGDIKKRLPWKGWKKQYSAENKNFYSFSSLSTILSTIQRIGTNEANAYIKNIVVDGFNNAMIAELFLRDNAESKNAFEKYQKLAEKVYQIINAAQNLRDDLNVIFMAHVETADPYTPNDVDKVFTPGKMLKDKVKLESKFLYVFYAKSDDGKEFYFETTPNKSTARAPFECLDERIPNDLAAALKVIEVYEEGEE